MLSAMRVTFFREDSPENSPPLAEISMVAVPNIGDTVSVVSSGAMQFSGVVTSRSWVVVKEGEGTAVVIYIR